MISKLHQEIVIFLMRSYTSQFIYRFILLCKYISFTDGTDHCNSKFSKNIQLEKIFTYLSYVLKNQEENQGSKVVYWKVPRVLLSFLKLISKYLPKKVRRIKCR